MASLFRVRGLTCGGVDVRLGEEDHKREGVMSEFWFGVGLLVIGLVLFFIGVFAFEVKAKPSFKEVVVGVSAAVFVSAGLVVVFVESLRVIF